MAKSDEAKGMSGWWLAVLGIASIAFGVGAYLLDSFNIINVSYGPLITSPVGVGVVLVITGSVMGIRGTRVESDGRNRYGRLMNKDNDVGR
ncbi:hypothetical protein D9V29_03940 [Mycetocola manganoxydans]|uniref:Uncharacterized protein n=1 Tax=Mycetocola manganoxydans TaxID=699879 RepID=A0A3L6ZZU6_9MICO|nr:hypothetical protein [Mycetocola manganoxydans]RLP72702.1 hypothetical protein D9V29_03940 [Mycetocola manganoxydans]GHD43389.1 hypothetical protein GCM10008097_10370 [Mycetocola manganoxydans]